MGENFDPRRIKMESLRSDRASLDDDIPESPNKDKKPRELLDPDEEIAVLQRRLRTKRDLLGSMQPDEQDKKLTLQGEITTLESDLKYFENKKKKAEELRAYVLKSRELNKTKKSKQS